MIIYSNTPINWITRLDEVELVVDGESPKTQTGTGKRDIWQCSDCGAVLGPLRHVVETGTPGHVVRVAPFDTIFPVTDSYFIVR